MEKEPAATGALPGEAALPQLRGKPYGERGSQQTQLGLKGWPVQLSHVLTERQGSQQDKALERATPAGFLDQVPTRS